MISCQKFINKFKKDGIHFFSGVPCSIFKDLINYIRDQKDINHIIATSEGEAIGIASGYYLIRGKTPAVYMQNSGLGSAVDPLTSLTDELVYNIPLLLLVSWRGEPGIPDEPQHKRMGMITGKLLETLSIPYEVFNGDESNLDWILNKSKKYFVSKSSPFAIIFKKGTFAPYEFKDNIQDTLELTREEAIKTIIDLLDGSEVIIATTGKTSRELFGYREERGEGHEKDFLTVGSMGCCSSIAFGISQGTRKQVFVFDGDGAVLMEMGALATIGHYHPRNYKHIIFDNNSHDSTGGQKTVSESVDFAKVARACGYQYTYQVSTKLQLKEAASQLKRMKGPALLWVRVKKGARSDLGRPTTTPLENKKALMKFLKKDK